MPGVDLVKAGFGEVKDPAAREAADAGERVSLFFKDGFRLMRDDGSFALFKPGENSVLASDADHWMVKAHIIEPPAAPEPAVKAPEPRSNVVLNSGAETAKEGGQPAAAGQQGLGVANGQQTAEELAAIAQQQNSGAVKAAAAAASQAPQAPQAPKGE